MNFNTKRRSSVTLKKKYSDTILQVGKAPISLTKSAVPLSPPKASGSNPNSLSDEPSHVFNFRETISFFHTMSYPHNSSSPHLSEKEDTAQSSMRESSSSSSSALPKKSTSMRGDSGVAESANQAMNARQQSTEDIAPPSVATLQFQRRALALSNEAAMAAANKLPTLENHPHYSSFKRMEAVLRRMVYEEDRVPVRNVKTLLTTTPSVFRGIDLVTWLVDHLKVDRMQALHFAHLMAVHGYVFPIDDHCLTVKNDNSLYRFQTPCLWLSNCLEPDDSEYAIYLCKRTLTDKQRLQLLDYETDALDRLQRQLMRRWDSICIQAEAQYRVDRKRPKSQQKILDGQERAFWDVFQPVPGCVKPMELDYRKSFRLVSIQRLAKTKEVIEEERKAKLFEEISIIKKTLERTRSKVSKTFENLKLFTAIYTDYDGFTNKVEPSNPWVSDSIDLWETEKANASAGNLSLRRVRRWGFNIQELLRDPAGVEHFSRFLEKEFSAENLRFYRACRELCHLPVKEIASRVQVIYDEHLASGCSDPVNIDSRVAELVRSRLVQGHLDRYTFDEAEDQIFNLMKNDSYNRFLRSDFYRELPAVKKKASLMDAVRGMILQLAPATSGNTSNNMVSTGVVLSVQAPLQTCVSSPTLVAQDKPLAAVGPTGAGSNSALATIPSTDCLPQVKYQKP